MAKRRGTVLELVHTIDLGGQVGPKCPIAGPAEAAQCIGHRFHGVVVVALAYRFEIPPICKPEIRVERHMPFLERGAHVHDMPEPISEVLGKVREIVKTQLVLSCG